ncbi:hypothetical protein KR222_009575, partial [Zaprionus bogoriensis]
KSKVTAVPATTFRTVPRRYMLLAIRWWTFRVDNKFRACSISTSKSFLICDCGNKLVNLSVSSIIIN